jgi:DNA-binding MarR family transcriptional regulator
MRIADMVRRRAGRPPAVRVRSARHGWAERRRDVEDRRRHVVDIAPTGREALFRAERALDGLEEEVLADLSPHERDTLRDLLARTLAAAAVPA